MKKLALGGMVLAAVALTGPAFAADLPPAYKTPVFVPPYSWSGFYIGANAGGSWGRDTTDYNVFGFPLFSTSQNLKGFIGGGQIGWNWQTGAWVWGVEADFQGTSQKGDIVTPIDGFGTTNDYNQKLSWLGTVRGRVGFTPAPRWLIYATGGFTYANVSNGRCGGRGPRRPNISTSTSEAPPIPALLCLPGFRLSPQTIT